jgi:hypothetical protein
MRRWYFSMSQLQNPKVLRLAESGCGLSARYEGVKLRKVVAGFGVTSGKSTIYSSKAERQSSAAMNQSRCSGSGHQTALDWLNSER